MTTISSSWKAQASITGRSSYHVTGQKASAEKWNTTGMEKGPARLRPRQHARSGAGEPARRSSGGTSQARGWTAVEYVDRGVSGAKDRRPALDQLVTDARRRRFDVVVCWRLDRLGRNLKHLITLLEELQALGVAFVSLAEGIDATTPAGKLQMHILGAIAEFERERIRERVLAGLQRARAQGKRLGRPKPRLPIERLQRVAGLTVDVAAERLGVSRSTIKRWRRLKTALRSDSMAGRSSPEQVS